MNLFKSDSINKKSRGRTSFRKSNKKSYPPRSYVLFLLLIKTLFKLLVVVSIVIILPGLSYLAILKFIKINKIDCIDRNTACTSEIQKILDKHTNKSMAFTKKSVANYLDMEPSVTSYNLKYQFPDILKVELVRNEPRFLLVNKIKNSFAQVSLDGKVISMKDKQGLLVIEVSEDLPSKNEKVRQEAIYSLSLINKLSTYYSEINANLLEDYLILKIERFTFLLPLEGDEDLLLGKLVLAHSQLNSLTKESTIDKTKEARALQEKCTNSCIVDLRFKNPVIKSQLDANI